MTEPSEPPSPSGVESASDLLSRVRGLLAAEAERERTERTEPTGPAGPTGLPDSVLDLAKPDGLGPGWYDAETFDGRAARWTSRRFEFEATVRDATHLEIEAALFPESGFDSLTGRILAEEVPGISFTIRPGWNSLLLPVPGGLRGHLRFRIDAGGSWCPADKTGAPDTRSLSILVRRIAFVRFVELPRSSGLPTDPGGQAVLEPWPRSGSKPVRAIQKVRRVLGLAWHIDDLVAHVHGLARQADGLASHIDALEDRLDRTSALLEDRLTRLAEADARLAADAAEREETLRDDVARTLKGLRRG